jgi:hypothetical protein
MPRGGRRPGAGRKAGSRNKAKLIAEAREREIVISGKDPLDYMLEVMRNPDASWRRRDEMAKAAAPYLHARLAAVEHSARRCHRQSRSSRHGLALISTATPCSAQVARIASISASYPGRRSSCRPFMRPTGRGPIAPHQHRRRRGSNFQGGLSARLQRHRHQALRLALQLRGLLKRASPANAA